MLSACIRACFRSRSCHSMTHLDQLPSARCLNLLSATRTIVIRVFAFMCISAATCFDVSMGTCSSSTPSSKQDAKLISKPCSDSQITC
ncbi:hypothetical protein IE81DRAFT_128525 [Ceraceosorus guamensis]|uniref:Uncharacterized protein n=1 Tax=Ceraceosorus guamensis TaxID=1522189 RepID=A0A316W8I4_9BASI|nr:hypothetical protein IE81DRAFT_128525 [Ceraceosorus guamensis]PWN45864.1 hypothetical protein IE81DRAFT_128525 [Ceraceosorus guamensis]